MEGEAAKGQEEIKEEVETKEEEVLSPSDIFDQVFSEATDSLEKGEADKGGEEKDEVEVEGKEANKDDDTATDRGDKGEAATEDKQEASRARDDSEDKAQQGETKAEQPPVKAPEKEAAEEPPRVEKKEEPPAPVDLSSLFAGWENDIDDPELKKEITEFKSEGDAVSKYVDAATTVIGKRVLTYVNKSFEILVEKITPFLEATAQQMRKGQASEISQAHNDYDDLKKSGQVLEWIKEQPRYLQKSLTEVYESGSPEDVIDLFARYKREKGIGGAAAPAEEDHAQKDEAKAQAKAKIKDKISNLSAVRTKDRPVSIRQKTTNQDDFDSSFEEAAARR